MISVSKIWNPKQKLLLELLKNDSPFEEAISVCIDLHKQVHDLIVVNNSKTIYQELLQMVTQDAGKYRPKDKFSSIAWNIWHITRIEDAVSNILINNSNQILNTEIHKKINVTIWDTGNAFTEKDVDLFDEQIDIEELLKYRKNVGKNTEKILKSLKVSDRKRKPTEEQLMQIIKNGVVTSSQDSIWLVDFWKNKTIAGLLTMPITRHQIVHINDCFKLLEKYKMNR